MAQARLALLGAGKLAAVDAAIAAIPDAAKKQAARIEWEYAGTVHRDHGLVSQIGPALGLTSAQIDALFVAASNCSVRSNCVIFAILLYLRRSRKRREGYILMRHSRATK